MSCEEKDVGCPVLAFTPCVPLFDQYHRVYYDDGYIYLVYWYISIVVSVVCDRTLLDHRVNVL